MQGDGYEPGALVTITLASPGSASAEDGFADVLGTITADSTGSIDTDVTIPPSATGFSISSWGCQRGLLRTRPEPLRIPTPRRRTTMG